MELPRLTLEERTILDRLGRGLTYKETQMQLNMSKNTFYLAIRLARAKLGAETTIHAVAIAIKRKLIDPIGNRDD